MGSTQILDFSCFWAINQNCIAVVIFSSFYFILKTNLTNCFYCIYIFLFLGGVVDKENRPLSINTGAAGSVSDGVSDGVKKMLLAKSKSKRDKVEGKKERKASMKFTLCVNVRSGAVLLVVYVIPYSVLWHYCSVSN